LLAASVALRQGIAMTDVFLKPTVVQSIRSFLGESGLVVDPCAGLHETLAALFGLFAARREDRPFWERLQGLLSELGEARAGMPWGHGLPTPAAEIVRPAELDGILGELRAAIESNGQGKLPSLGASLSKLGAPAACCVLLLGLATGCSATRERSPVAGGPAASNDPVATASAPAPMAEPTALPSGAASIGPAAVTAASTIAAAPSVPSATVEPAPTASAAPSRTMVQIVDQSDLKPRIKANLKRCLLGAYEQQEREDLVELFRKKSPEEVAQALEQMVQSERCDEYFGRPKPKVKRPPAVTLYKGVSFPDV
jgi:hypothetical protein